MVGKTVLMFAVAVLGLRLAQRRTLAQWTIIDVVAAVAVGAIVGRTAVAGSESSVTGAVALGTLVAAHRLLSRLRLRPSIRPLLDHRIRILVADGELRRDQLRLCGIPEDDLYAHLRENGVADLSELRYLIYESKGGLTIVRHDVPTGATMIRLALDGAKDYP